MRRPRAWRITMWTSLAATVLLVGGAIGSRGWYCALSNARGTGVGLNYGALAVGFNPDLPPVWWVSGPATYPAPWWQCYSDDSAPFGWEVAVSLWLPAGATFAVSGLSAFMVYWPRRRPGHCPKCGYDRSGLPTDAPCPECGKEVKS